MSLVAFAFHGGTALAASQTPGAPTAAEGTTTPEPPPFIESTGHGLAPSQGGSTPLTGGTSTSSSLTSGSSKSTNSSVKGTSDRYSPAESYLSWLYRLLGMDL